MGVWRCIRPHDWRSREATADCAQHSVTVIDWSLEQVCMHSTGWSCAHLMLAWRYMKHEDWRSREAAADCEHGAATVMLPSAWSKCTCTAMAELSGSTAWWVSQRWSHGWAVIWWNSFTIAVFVDLLTEHYFKHKIATLMKCMIGWSRRK
jgi:hypothetical protein